MNKSLYLFYIKKNLKDLFEIMFPNLEESEYYTQHHPLTETSEESIQDFYRNLSLRLLFLVVFSAKVLDLFLFPCYYFIGDLIYLKISTQQNKIYPLCVGKRWELDAVVRSSKFLYADFLKILKMLGLECPTHFAFKTYSDFFGLLKIFRDRFLEP